jgi:hypothetical protein
MLHKFAVVPLGQAILALFARAQGRKVFSGINPPNRPICQTGVPVLYEYPGTLNQQSSDLFITSLTNSQQCADLPCCMPRTGSVAAAKSRLLAYCFPSPISVEIVLAVSVPTQGMLSKRLIQPHLRQLSFNKFQIFNRSTSSDNFVVISQNRCLESNYYLRMVPVS